MYPVLRALEESGGVRRGYFVDGLGAAQFACGAVDRLRSMRSPTDTLRPIADAVKPTAIPPSPQAETTVWTESTPTPSADGTPGHN